jgi:hypothetical protein
MAHQPLFVSVASDRFTGDHEMRQSDRDALLELPDSQTESLMGALPLCEGLPVVLKKTINPLLKLCNGSRGRIVRIIRDDPDADQRLELAAAEPLFLKAQPKCVLVHFPECEKLVHLKGLPAGVVPIYPVESSSFDFHPYAFWDDHTQSPAHADPAAPLQVPHVLRRAGPDAGVHYAGHLQAAQSEEPRAVCVCRAVPRRLTGRHCLPEAVYLRGLDSDNACGLGPRNCST